MEGIMLMLAVVGGGGGGGGGEGGGGVNVLEYNDSKTEVGTYWLVVVHKNWAHLGNAWPRLRGNRHSVWNSTLLSRLIVGCRV